MVYLPRHGEEDKGLPAQWKKGKNPNSIVLVRPKEQKRRRQCGGEQQPTTSAAQFVSVRQHNGNNRTKTCRTPTRTYICCLSQQASQLAGVRVLGDPFLSWKGHPPAGSVSSGRWKIPGDLVLLALLVAAAGM